MCDLEAFFKKRDKYAPEVRRAINRLHMTVGEITANYRQSDKRASDIQRLADLNGCSKALIKEILNKELGEKL
jgi:hypothetical protein